ncbi:efflux RND transporter periplasmic adaptor subunit [Blastomonas sp. SL216]|uniref:efflux RND transporter periplasmic adaptor subunit n=1 Tax=Blastomonas sp. SL216 TaxID=2995169 RepID=UPI00237718D6|nr:efflux RND transporter periplasmic adaptor subunit [Blastomonas sp. SL216]
MLTKLGSWVKRHKVWSALIALVLLFIVYRIVRPTPHEYEYISETVARGEVQRVVSASGKVRALNTIKVGTEVSGQVTKVYVDFNSPVTAGQVLAEIDPTRVRARVQQIEAQVALARAGLQQTVANVARARAELQIQERDFARQKSLAERGFVSKANLDAAQTRLNSARNALEVATAQTQSGDAQIRQANAELSSARLDLTRTVIIAPASGVIINKLVEPGTTVAASFQTPNLFEIAADTTKMQVEASVDEADIGQIVEGQDVNFTVDSYPDDVFRAKVRQIRKAPVETQNVVSYLVIIDVDNLDGKLLPGMTANVEIITGAKRNVLRVPTNALRFRPKPADRGEPQQPAEPSRNDSPRQVLYLVSTDPYRPTRKPVKIGLQGDDYTEIVSGIKSGDKVLVRTKSLKPRPESEDTEDDDSAAS